MAEEDQSEHETLEGAGNAARQKTVLKPPTEIEKYEKGQHVAPEEAAETAGFEE